MLWYVLSGIVKELLNSRELDNVESHWASLKEVFTTDTDIPRKNKAAIADWARQNLSRRQADTVIRAIEKYTSDDLRSSERLKQLDSNDVKELLESLRLLVAADFNIFEIFLGAVKEKDDPGGAVRDILRQMRDYENELKYNIEAKKRAEEEKRRREEEEKRRREEEEKRRREEEEKRRREEEEKMRREEEEKRRRDVHGVHLNVNIPPSTVRADSVDSSLKAQPDDLSPEQVVPADASLEPVVRWDIVNSFDSSGGTMQKERSQVVLQIPPHAVKPNMFADVCLAVCTDVERIHHLFSLGDCDFVASPMVEGSAGADFLFELPVEITLPHCLPRQVSPAQLIVYRAAADSKGKRVLWKVPAHQDQAGDRPSTHADVPWDDGATYRVTDDRKIVIKTRRFSSYVCIQCREENLGSPIVLFIGSGTNKLMTDQTQAAIVDVHIWDERLSILDFAEKIQNRVTDAEQLTVDLAGVDQKNKTVKLHLDVTGKSSSLWRHCRKGGSLPSLPEERKIPLEEVLGCNIELCSRNRKVKPFVVHWMLETSEPTTNALMLQCVLDITFVQETCKAQLPITLKEPLNRQQLRELNLQQLKDALFDLGLLSSNDIDGICPAGGNGEENDLSRKLIERAEVNRRRPPPLAGLEQNRRRPPSPDRLEQNPRRPPSPDRLEQNPRRPPSADRLEQNPRRPPSADRLEQNPRRPPSADRREDPTQNLNVEIWSDTSSSRSFHD